MLQQTHYFAPVRPPSPTFLRPDHSTHLSEYISSLRPPTPSPYRTPAARKRSRSASPTPANRLPTRSQTAPLPLPPLNPILRRSPSFSHVHPAVPLRSILRPPHPDLPPIYPRRAATDGPPIVHSDPSSPHASSPSSSSTSPKPTLTQLARTPSSAFMAASKEGRVHPLTLQAVARRDSEQEALRMVKERKETERRRENSSGETERGTALSAAGSGGIGGGGGGGGGGGWGAPVVSM
ncbi:hypothetical protein JCM11641_003896 [Rhodosporidiobolus odoratus]